MGFLEKIGLGKKPEQMPTPETEQIEEKVPEQEAETETPETAPEEKIQE